MGEYDIYVHKRREGGEEELWMNLIDWIKASQFPQFLWDSSPEFPATCRTKEDPRVSKARSSPYFLLAGLCIGHELNNYKDTKSYMSSSLVFIVWRDSQSCWYFRTALWTIAPLTFSLVSSPPLPCVNKYDVYTYTVCKRGGSTAGVIGEEGVSDR